VKWLLSKAYNNKVPENLREPFYRDQEVMCFALCLVVTVMYSCRKSVHMKVYKEYVSKNYWSLVVKLRLSKGDGTVSVSFSELMIRVFFFRIF
jgi:hypothetical protein